MMKNKVWQEILLQEIPTATAQEIDVFEGQIALKRLGRLDDKVFSETRLRRGVYGQRYDNGQRHDGLQTQPLNFPAGPLTKGPDTLWDAPGMQRIKVPFGGLKAAQLDVLAQLAEEYADGVLHVTTRQDFQLHYVHIADTPDLMRRLAAVDMTTLEACGNSVRNVTACPLAGVCHSEAFDTTPYAKALTYFLLGHDDAQDFGRKFKIAFSGCEDEACALVKMHDLGLLARVRQVNGRSHRGFALYVGGGLGTVPHQAKLLSDFVAEAEILPVAQAIARVFARLGEKRNRNRARLKFLVAELGIEEFQRLVLAERAQLPYDPRWTAYLDSVPDPVAAPVTTAVSDNEQPVPEGFTEWRQTNVYRQRQPGYSVITINLPLGDLSSAQAYALADIARAYVGDNIRTTVEQNIVLRWVADADLLPLYADLKAVGLAQPGAGTIVDITSCPGTDTCKLGIAASRGLAAQLQGELVAQIANLPDAVKHLRIKISGCFNSCGQHHVADIGFFGNSRRRDNRTVPHFQVVLGGQWRENAGSYGLAVGAVPSKAAPAVLQALTGRYAGEREPGESFQAWVTRLGKKEVRAILEPFMAVPAYAENAAFYSDWGDPREFTLGDLGLGECAGEVVSLFAIEIARAEGEHFEALLALDAGDYRQADERAYRAMLLAARALARGQYLTVSDNPADIVAEFRRHFYETRLFFDKYAHGKFAQYLFKRHEKGEVTATADAAHELVAEAQLFIEAAHACDGRIAGVTIL
jgi:sulfite reductase (ferredoxin)